MSAPEAAGITAVINGERRTLDAGATLARAIEQSGLGEPGQPCVAAINGIHVPRGELAATVVREGDAIEILAVRQGG